MLEVASRPATGARALQMGAHGISRAAFTVPSSFAQVPSKPSYQGIPCKPAAIALAPRPVAPPQPSVLRATFTVRPPPPPKPVEGPSLEGPLISTLAEAQEAGGGAEQVARVEDEGL